MKIVSHSGSIVAVLLVSLSTGCAAFLAKKPATKTDVEKAKAAKDFDALKKICMDPEGEMFTRNAACEGGIALLAEKNDLATLKAICSGISDSDPNHAAWGEWRSGGEACPVADRVAGAGGLAELEAAPCEKAAEVWAKVKESVTAQAFAKEVRAQNFGAAARKLATCGQWDVIWTDVVSWGQDHDLGYQALVALGDDGAKIEDEFLAFLGRNKDNLLTFEHGVWTAENYVEYLNDKKLHARCADYLPFSDKMADVLWGKFNWFYRESKCAGAAEQAVKRLASDRSGTREGACMTIGLLGNKKAHLAKVKVLADSDPYSEVKEEGGYAVKVFPVKEACAAAMNKLQVK